MRALTCDRCKKGSGAPVGEVREIAVVHSPIHESDFDSEDLINNFDLCGRCRNVLRSEIKTFLKLGHRGK